MAPWTATDLEKHHSEVKGRDPADAIADDMVRIETRGELLTVRSRENAKLEIPLAAARGDGYPDDAKQSKEGALLCELKKRLWHFLEEDVNASQKTFKCELSRTQGVLRSGRSLIAGDLVYVWVESIDGKYVDEAPQHAPQPVAQPGRVKIMPRAKILVDDQLYSNRPFDSLAYILSEFIDNSLQVRHHTRSCAAFALASHPHLFAHVAGRDSRVEEEAQGSARLARTDAHCEG